MTKMKLVSQNWKFIAVIGVCLILSSCLKAPQFDVMLRERQIEVSESDGSVVVEFFLPDGPRKQDIEISYRYGGTAKEGKDFTSREEEYIFISEGDESVSFTISLIDNDERDGQKTIVIAILLVVSNGNSIFQGAERQSLVILIEDDDCSPSLGGEWDYTALYYMYSDGDTVVVGQDSQPLEGGSNPEFTGIVTLTQDEGYKNYIINDMFIGMFNVLDIETPSPLNDDCGILSGPNDGSILLMKTLPAQFNGILVDDDTLEVEFEYTDDENTGGGFGQAILKRRK